TRAAHGELLVAQLAGRLVGTASLFTAAAGPEWAETAAPGEGVLRMLAVDPAARGAGVGSALTTTCIERARALGCHRMLLLTQPSMTTAQRIYTRLGFVRDPGGDWDVRPDLRLLRYTLEL
ncbi:MAG TPA: GNAT family N-acetyltransferase, partial [Mycobacteriales bacterium]|nr:GNAT family N-acetyltransferase [Mycobacteriales bacterium]